MNLAKIGFETRIRQEEIMSEALAKDLKNMWIDIDTGRNFFIFIFETLSFNFFVFSVLQGSF